MLKIIADYPANILNRSQLKVDNEVIRCNTVTLINYEGAYEGKADTTQKQIQKHKQVHRTNIRKRKHLYFLQ